MGIITPEWVTAIATAAGAGAVIWGIITAKQKLNESLETRRETKRAEVAENLVVLAHEVHYALGDIRRTFRTIPKEKEKDKSYTYIQYYETVDKYSELFKSMHKAEIYARVVLGHDNVKEAIEVLFSARNEVLNAIESLSFYEGIGSISKDDREEMKEFRQIAFNTHSKDNVLTKKINDAVKTIDDCLTPIARMEK